MLLQVNNRINKKFLYKNISKSNYFFIFNIENSQNISFFYDYFIGNVSHSKQIINFLNKDKIELFAGNTYFCFVESSNFFKIFLDLYFFKIGQYKLDLVGICYNNFFLNFNMNYFNVLNIFYLNLVIIYFVVLSFICMFLFKLVLLFKKSLLLKKC